MTASNRIRISASDSAMTGRIQLPASKSISNRALILQAFAPERVSLENLSLADDTVVLQELLASDSDTLDVGRAGSAIRFLTAHCATIPGTKTLTGDDRMKQRPLGVLVDALRQLGAEIEYLGKEGYPPIRVTGKTLEGGRVHIPADVSSQFVTAMLLIAPRLKNGLDLSLQGEIASRPYVQMSVELLRWFGLEVELTYRRIVVKPQEIKAAHLKIEADWSSASYWYALAAMGWEANIELPGLFENSWQGDRTVADLFQPLGIITSFGENGIRLNKVRSTEAEALRVDCREFPDLAQTLAAVATGLRLPAYLSGLNTLRIKETDRIEAMIAELKKLGGHVRSASNETLIIEPVVGKFPESVRFRTYRDHRMALALTSLTQVVSVVEIDDPDVVSKSYPGFWKDLAEIGFSVERN